LESAYYGVEPLKHFVSNTNAVCGGGGTLNNDLLSIQKSFIASAALHIRADLGSDLTRGFSTPSVGCCPTASILRHTHSPKLDGDAQTKSLFVRAPTEAFVFRH
jgi:hypothetical protein